MATPRVLRFDAEAADPTPTDSDRYARERADVTAWKSRDTGACIALSSLLAESEETHFTRVRTASEFMTAIKARYATPTTVSLGRLFLPFLFPDLASFEHTANLITHMRSLDSSYRAACTNAQLAVLPPPMAITIYFIATNLPDHLASIRDALLLKHPSKLIIEALESALKDVESNFRSVASASGAVPTPLFYGCTVPQLPTFTSSLATAATDVTAAEQLELEQEERELERQQLELQRLEEQQQQQQPEQEQPQQQPQQQEQQPPPQLEEQRSQPQQEQQQQPPPPPVSGLRNLGLPSPSPPSPPSPSPPSPPSPPISGPPLPPRDPYPAVFPPPLPLLSPPLSHTWPSRRSPRARPSSPVPFTDLHTALFHSSPPRSYPSVLPSPPESALTASLSTPVTDYYRTYHPVLSRALASLVTDPRASLSSVSALTAAVTEFASTRCLEYAISLMAAPPTSPLAVGGESALGCDALEDRQFELEEKRPPGSPLVFKARYVVRGFSQREGVDFFQTFAPTPKMTNLRVLLHVAALRDYKLHSLDFSTAFLQGSLHEEVWLRRPSAITGTFPPGTQWRLRQPVYGLRHSPREWHDTLRSTLFDLGFQPSSADPSLFVRRDSTPFFVLVYVDDLVFATADRVALADVKLELQKRHTCTDLGELRHYLGLRITRDRAARTITLSQSRMVQQVLQRFKLQHSTVQRTPLAVDHRLTGTFPDESFEPSGPYAELVGCLIYLMTCTRPDLAFPLSILARFVAPERHRPVHWTAAVKVAKYLATTSGVGLVLGGRQDVVLTSHCDSSYADDAEQG
ncbi:unnamed protein product [Closterium sp. NIES-53]